MTHSGSVKTLVGGSVNTANDAAIRFVTDGLISQHDRDTTNRRVNPQNLEQ